MSTTDLTTLVTYASSVLERHDGVDALTDALRLHPEANAVPDERLRVIAARVHIEARIAALLATGYATKRFLRTAVTDTLEPDEYELIPEDLDALIDTMWDARVQEQRSWPKVTDVNRLEQAFNQLRRDGIVAEVHFTCCQRCGVSEIGGLVAEGFEPAGYTFFHQQDTASAVAGEGLSLAYGAFAAQSTDAEHAAIGHRVVTALQAQGLSPEWNGSPDKRIYVPLIWQRRLPPDRSSGASRQAGQSRGRS